MKSLLEAYRMLDKKIWDYYDPQHEYARIDNPFNHSVDNLDNHKCFIKKYFGIAGKREVLQQFEVNSEFFSGERAIHTNSVFFFGLILQEKTILKTKIFEGELSKMDYEIFPFLWFLSILFHDYGMMIEENSHLIKDKIVTLEDLMKEYSIDNNLLDKIVENTSDQLTRLISKYFIYRRFSSKKIDHGIFAGVYLFDRLVKIRRIKSIQNNSEFSWHESLEEYYALSSVAIACHNIWTTRKDSPFESGYIEYELRDLVVPNFKEISLDNFPLLFLFGLVDTIDPVKIYTRVGFSPEIILTSLYITITKRSMTIINGKDSTLDFDLIKNATKNLKGWLKVKIDISHANKLKINF